MPSAGLLLLLCVSLCTAQEYYVDSTSNRTEDCGSSWAEACGTMASGVTAACGGDKTRNATLWVGPGVYEASSLFIICNLQIISSNGSDVTIIQESKIVKNNIFIFQSDYPGLSSLVGFTFSVHLQATAIFFTGSPESDMVTDDIQFLNYNQSGIRSATIVAYGGGSVTVSNVKCNQSNLFEMVLVIGAPTVTITDMVIESSTLARLADADTVDQFTMTRLRTDTVCITEKMLELTRHINHVWLDSWDLYDTKPPSRPEGKETIDCFLCTTANDILITNSSFYISSGSGTGFHSLLSQSGTGPVTARNVSFRHISGIEMFIVGGDITLENTAFVFIQTTKSLFTTNAKRTIWSNVTAGYVNVPVFAQHPNAMFGLVYQIDNTRMVSCGMNHLINLPVLDSATGNNITVSNSNFTNISAFIGTKDFSSTALWAMGATDYDPNFLTLQSVIFTDVAVGISNRANTMKIKGCTFNRVNTQDRYAIQTNEASSLFIENCEFKNSNGYGILLVDTTRNVTIASTRFESNQMTVSGMSFRYSAVYMKDVAITGNSVPSTSGSFVMSESNVYFILSNSSLDNNVAYSGGALSLASFASITSCQFHQNRATSGGAIFASHSASLVISNCSFEENVALISGGALWIGGLAGAVVNDCTISNSQSATQGGGLLVSGNATLTAANLSISASTSLSGGCIAMSEYATADFDNVNLTSCKAFTDGGGFTVSGYAHAQFSRLILSQCYVEGVGGGAIVTDYSKMDMVDSVVWSNFSPTEGGGVYLDERSNTTFANVTFARNIAAANGGGVAMSVRSISQFDQCHFYNNSARSKGGAIAMANNAHAIVLGTTFNVSRANSGGGIYLDDTTSLVMEDSEMTGQTTTGRGGAISCASASSMVISNTLLMGNTAAGVGGAVTIQDLATVEISNSTISNNQGVYGGAIYSSSGDILDLANTTLETNTATTDGGGLYLAEQAKARLIDFQCLDNRGSNGGCISAGDQTDISISNSILDSNSAAQSGGAVLLSQQASLWLTSTMTCQNNARLDGGAYWVGKSAYMYAVNSTISNNWAFRNGGGVYFQASLSQLDNVSIELNSAQSGGGVAMSMTSTSQPAMLWNCSIRENTASNLGGGVYLFQESGTAVESEEEFPLELTTSFRAEESNTTFYNFADANIFLNGAINGGGIYIETVTSNLPTFGPTVNLTANAASKYGGAIYFGTYLPSVFMYNATFSADLAGYGGSNVGYGTIVNTSQAGDFCQDCTFTDPLTNLTGYESSDGFASAPSKISFGSAGCPATVPLNGSPFSIPVYLVDQFGNQVTGRYLTNNPYTVTMVYSQPEGGELSTTNRTQPISPDTGAASFTDIQFCGDNNSTYTLQFTASSSSAAAPRSFQTTCSIYLFGCTDSNQEVDTSGACDTCVSKNRPLGVIGILLLVIFILMAVLCVILSTIFVIYSRRKWKQAQYNALEIPDFSERPSLTLADVLNDSSILQLNWQDVKIGMVIGKGASGLVSQGVWTPSDGQAQEVALKELIIGLEDLTEEGINEFLVEIKYMSALIDDNIVRFLGILLSPDESKLYLVTELMHKGSVRDILTKKNKNLPPSLRLKMAKDAAKGVAYLHSKKLIHRDLKTHNLLVNSQWDTKVSDFGISTVRPTITRAMTCIGTPVYMAPEVLSKNKYSEKADVFSFGVVLMEIFTNRHPYSHPPYDTMNQAMLMYHIIEKEARPSLEGVHTNLQHLISECWDSDPHLRPTFSEIVVRLRRMNSQMVLPASISGGTESDDNYQRANDTNTSDEQSKLLDQTTSSLDLTDDLVILPDI